MKGIELEKEKLDRQKKKIQLKERVLREKEKQRRASRFKDVGKLAFQVNIDGLERDVLLGAFLEIAEKVQNNETVQKWKTRAENFLKQDLKNNDTPLSVTFDKEPAQEVKDQLKEMNFKWSQFRKEYYGYGCRETVGNMLKNSSANIEVVS